MDKKFDRRVFTQNLGLGISSFMIPMASNAKTSLVFDDKNINHIGPKSGFTPHVGTVVSMLDWLSNSVIQYNRKLTVEQLDFLFDSESNTIGSLMMHLAATEVIYQDITFHNLDDFTPENKKKWNIAMDLGEDARKIIKGNPLSYYKDMFEEVRSVTKSEMKKRDDKWLLEGDTKDWDWNNYCKWFHVAEHYANHRGQMTWYSRRLPK